MNATINPGDVWINKEGRVLRVECVERTPGSVFIKTVSLPYPGCVGCHENFSEDRFLKWSNEPGTKRIYKWPVNG